MHLKAAVISLGSKSSKMTVESMKTYFKTVDHLNIKELEITLGDDIQILHKGEPIESYDCVYAKGSFRYTPILQILTSILGNECYMPNIESSFSIANDKVLTQLQLQASKVPTPKTYITSSAKAVKNILSKINYPIIMKFPQGTQGRGVMVADSRESASSMLDALQALKQPFLIQEFVETGGVDIRAFVVGDKVVASMKRKAMRGEARANIHAGATGAPCTLDPYTKKIAVEAAQAIGANICGVDILEGVKGPVVIEVNISPGLRGITEVTKIDVASKIADFLHKQTKELRSEGKKESAGEILKAHGIEQAGNDIITNLDFRGKRILLPEIITTITRFDEKDEVQINASEKKIEMKKFSVG